MTSECPVSKWMLFAVCDGHGGTAVVKHVEKILAKRVLAALGRASIENAATTSSTSAKSPYSVPVRAPYLRQCLKLLVVALDNELHREITTGKGRNSGCTLIMMAYQPLTRQIALVNLGDSRAVLSFPTPVNTPATAGAATAATNAGTAKAPIAAAAAGKAAGSSAAAAVVGVAVGSTVDAKLAGGGVRATKLIETKDHKPDDKDELLRVTAAGSFVKGKRVGGILALSRALGDFTLKGSLRLAFDPVNGAVCALPDVQVGYVAPAQFATAILGCDGIWDVMSSQEAIDVADAALANKENPADKLVHVAFQKLSSDNLTCLVVRLHPMFKPPTTG